MLPPSGRQRLSHIEPRLGVELEGSCWAHQHPTHTLSLPVWKMVCRGSSDLSVLFSLNYQTWPTVSPRTDHMARNQGTYQGLGLSLVYPELVCRYLPAPSHGSGWGISSPSSLQFSHKITAPPLSLVFRVLPT